MAKDTNDLIEEALRLPAEARAVLIESLLNSLDTEVDEDAEEVWRIEIERRVADFEAGRGHSIPWSEVRDRLIQLRSK
jgi:putative addiction module component (TIGR02574 family)